VPLSHFVYNQYTRCGIIEAMAKKKHKKKHNFKHTAASPVAAPAASAVASSTAKGSAKPNTMPNEWQEVAADVNRALILAGVFIALMVGLWLLFEYTSFGPQLYNSIRL